jgi:cell division septum initiation protein DivIVA
LEGLMENLKKSFTGKYNAGDVDRLLVIIREDYEKCLKGQKERIIQLREENRELLASMEKYRSNEKYIVEVISRAEKTAKTIINEAEGKAKEIFETAIKEEKNIRTDVEINCQRLYKLKRASEAIFRSVAKVIGEHIEIENVLIQNNIRPMTIFSSNRLVE